ncbi:uncharacterized protein [Antedon mediterranea]|uniref:uncharacterized protein n=1 Tax=Antedon mediterranea TaxID=105859 RepID=UPI003AF747F5
MKRAEVEAIVEEISESIDDFKYMPKLIKAVTEFEEEEDVKKLNMRVLRNVIDKVLSAAKKSKGKESKAFAGLAVAMAEKKMSMYCRRLKSLFNDRNIVNWKDHSTEAIQIIETFIEPPKIKMTDDDERWYGTRRLEECEMSKRIKDCAEAMVKAFLRDKLAKKIEIKLLQLLINCFEKSEVFHLMIARGMLYQWNFKPEDRTLIPKLIKTVDEWTRKFDEIMSKDNPPYQVTIVEKSLEIAFNSNCPPKLYLNYVVTMWKNALTKELEGQPLTGWGIIACEILNGLINQKASMFDMTELAPGVMTLIRADIDRLTSSACRVISSMYEQIDALAPWTEELVDLFLDNDEMCTSIGMSLKPLYIKCPEKIMSKMDLIFEKLPDLDANRKRYLYLFFDNISKTSTKTFVPHIDTLIEDINESDIRHKVLMVLCEIAAKYPEKFVNHIESLTGLLDSDSNTVYFVDKIVASVGTVNKEWAIKILKILIDQLQTVQTCYHVYVLMELKRIGHIFPECLTEYRKEIEAMKGSSQTGIKDIVIQLIDVMEGRTLEGLHENIVDQREDIEVLDTRVTNTENNVAEVTEKVEEQGREITAVKTDVAEQGQKLEELEEVVDETVLKVDDIDHKTITNAPKWSRDVSKLLNPEADYDWRFLAIRLGYSGEDIRNWALSPDPTMAILAEWYTTHKSSDATYAILTALEDMGQAEAVKIVEESLEQADAMVPKLEPGISEKPPKVFISYQWDHQSEVKAIRDHLEMAGFACWMDIGQMGGGDNLYAKINEGMRAAKVVLCMTTDKYSKSENCNKEVNLANLLNKPIIPILIERTVWPPEGPMSMLFAQLLYIQFFTDKHNVRGDKFWVDTKFCELLAQVSYYAAPDLDKITDEYKSWVPTVEAPEQEIKQAKKDDKGGETKVVESEQQAEIEPEVFISYQWDHQPQIKVLYQRLTSLGYSCWLDIKQMGGGDPLYSKIDKGLRKAKVVISCVTPKYSLSANCRREVSLSDALRRPIIPILLQQMAWPPEGPMSMTFTQLLYIDFTKESSQESFIDEQFDELIIKINEHAQAVEGKTSAKLSTPDQPKPTSEDSTPEEPKFEDPNHEESKCEDPKPEEPKFEDPTPQEQQFEDPTPQDPKPEDPKPEEPKPEEPKPKVHAPKEIPRQTTPNPPEPNKQHNKSKACCVL